MGELRIQWFCLEQLITRVGRERRYLTFVTRKASQRGRLPGTVPEQGSSWLQEEREKCLVDKREQGVGSGMRCLRSYQEFGIISGSSLKTGFEAPQLKGCRGNREPLRGWGNEGTRSDLHCRPITWWSTGEDRLGEARPKLGRSGRRPLQSLEEKSVRL